MEERQTKLTDVIFKNSKYIDTIQKTYNIKNFKKEHAKQYSFMFDTFQTLILLNNCFFSDSNISMSEKVGNALTISEELIYSVIMTITRKNTP